MTRRLLLLAGALVSALVLPTHIALADTAIEDKSLVSTNPTDANIAEIEADMLQTWQYSQHPFDEEISGRFLDRYLETLDYYHTFFLQPDISAFETYRTNLHMLTMQDHDVSPCWIIFDRFMERAKERVQFVTNEIATMKFDFTGHERFIVNRHTLPYAKDMDQAREFWRQQLRCEYLQQLLEAQSIEFTGTITNVTATNGTTFAHLLFTKDKVRTSDFDFFPHKLPGKDGRAVATVDIVGTNATVSMRWTKGANLAKLTNSFYSATGAPLGEIYFRPIPPDISTNATAGKMTVTVTNYAALLRLNETNIAAIRKTLTNQYAQMLQNYTELDRKRVFEMYMNALARAYDPHSEYMGHLSAENFGIQMKLSLFGIGAILQRDKDYCKIHELIKTGPAAKTGQINVGDRIVAVAQSNAEPVDVIGMPLEKIVEMIRGPKGTQVTLTIIPMDAPETAHKNVTIVRDEIKLEDQAAKAMLFEEPRTNAAPLKLGVIDLSSFYANNDHPEVNTTSDVTRLINRLKKENVDGIILDLRRNGGGYLEEAIKLTGLFNPPGPVVQTRDPNGEVVADPSPEPAPLYDGPLVVLTSVLSASASEILAGALQDYGRALMVGDHSTFGKGTVQSMQPLSNYMELKHLYYSYDPGELKVTIKKFYRAGGVSTQLQGVLSDIELPSIDDVADIGERSLPNAMPCDKVTSADHLEDLVLNRVKPYLAELQARSRERLATNKDFSYIREDIEQFRKEQADKSISLNITERRAELKAQNDRNKAIKKERASRPKSNEKVYELTQKNIDLAQLQPVDVKTNSVARKAMTDLDSDDDSPPDELSTDPTLEETKRILSDYIELLKKGPGISRANESQPSIAPR